MYEGDLNAVERKHLLELFASLEHAQMEDRIAPAPHDEEGWEQCYDVATVRRWCPINRGRRSRAGHEKSVP